MNWASIGALAMALAVLTGAFGAHGLRSRVSPTDLAIWETAVRYHALHALGCFAVAWVRTQPRCHPRLVDWAGWGIVIGVALFSGSLYVLVLSGERWLGAVTPIGGTIWIAAWVALAFGARRR